MMKAFVVPHYITNIGGLGGKPLFTLAEVTVIWLSFIYGLLFVIGWKNVSFTATGPVSPPDTKIWYIYIDIWPTCIVHRKEIWRLLTVQLVHAGIVHILSNTFIAIVYGVLFESMHGSLLALIIFQIGIIEGTICHANIWAYHPLVGCSHGIYALIGGNFASLLFNRKEMPKFLKLMLGALCFTQLIVDVFSYFFMYGKNIGYSAHFAAEIQGFLLSGFLINKLSPSKFKFILSLIFLVIFGIISSFLVYYYVTTWPPKMMLVPIAPTNDIHEPNCCAEIFNIVDRGWPISDAQLYYNCINDNLVERN